MNINLDINEYEAESLCAVLGWVALGMTGRPNAISKVYEQIEQKMMEQGWGTQMSNLLGTPLRSRPTKKSSSRLEHACVDGSAILGGDRAGGVGVESRGATHTHLSPRRDLNVNRGGRWRGTAHPPHPLNPSHPPPLLETRKFETRKWIHNNSWKSINLK